MIAGGAAITSLRQKHGVLPYTVSLSAPEQVRAGKTYAITLTVTAPATKSQKPEELTIEFHSSPDVTVTPSETKAPMAPGKISASLTWTPGASSAARANRAFVAARVRGPKGKPQFVMAYFQGDTRKEPAGPDKEQPAAEKKP